MLNRETQINCNLLPALFYKVLKDLLIYSRVLNGRYGVEFTSFYEITETGNRKLTLEQYLRYEVQ